jgi:hypothetical protein
MNLSISLNNRSTTILFFRLRDCKYNLAIIRSELNSSLTNSVIHIDIIEIFNVEIVEEKTD